MTAYTPAEVAEICAGGARTVAASSRRLRATVKTLEKALARVAELEAQRDAAFDAGLTAAAGEAETFPDGCHGEDRASQWLIKDVSAAILELRKEKP